VRSERGIVVNSEKATFTIRGRCIGPGRPALVVAEISANHNQRYEDAVALIKAAKDAGADAVKLQTYTPDTMTLQLERECFRISGGTLWDGRTLYDLYAEAHMPWEWQPKLKHLANSLGMELFSTAFDATAVDFLEQMETPVHKVASFELVDIPLIKKMARTGKPLILSTGMAALSEIEEAVHAAREAGAVQVALLKCTSAYPAPPEEMNLRTIPHMAEAFGAPVGLSDHTMGIAVPVAAVTIGACVIEKHFTLSRSPGGPDAAFSLEPSEFKAMVEAIRTAERALGSVHYGLTQNGAKNQAFRRSLFAVEDIAPHEPFTLRNIRAIRPSNGLHPRFFDQILTRWAARQIQKGEPLTWDMIESKAPEL
jgi:pseudaminic acid synthase